MVFRAKQHLLYWQISAGLLWGGVLCFLIKSQIETTVGANGFLHEPFFALIPLGYFLLLLGALLGLILSFIYLNRQKHSDA